MKEPIRSLLLLLALTLAHGCGATSSPTQRGWEQSTSTADDFLKRYDRLSSRIVSLCSKMTQRQLDWRPTPAVKSMIEVLGHLNATQWRLASFTGTAVPSDLDLKALEKLTEKSAVLTALKRSNAHARATVAALDNAAMERSAEVWGRPSTVRFAVLLIVAHQAEHLGQAIAYGRSQGVVPPWSR